jgi:hypothetical protein
VADELSYGREPIEIIELEQPRCSLRFGEAPCTATGTPKCFQTYWTCKDKPNYTPEGSIRWRFTKPSAGILPLYEQDGDNDISTNPLYILRSVRTNPTRINLGASRKGESPFGIRANIQVVLEDQLFDDHVGDFYLSDRPARNPRATFWQLWKARNPFYPGCIIRYYQGYRGQSLSEMQVSLFFLNAVQGPSNGTITLQGDDPLQFADDKKALFPRSTDLRLIGNIDSSTLAVRVFGLEADLSDTFGISSLDYLRIGSEIIGYSGYTDDGDGEFTLTGVLRGQRGTQVESHDDGEACQRVGAYDNTLMYKAAQDLLENHTQVPNAYINAAGQWDDEGGRWPATFRTTATVANPEPVRNLCGQLSRDGLFSIWWDERAQVIPLLAVRPPQETPIKITDELNILADSASVTEKPDDRMTRVTVLYGQRDPTEGLEEYVNYAFRRIRIDGEVELPEATDGTIRDNEIFSRWIRSQTNAFLLAAQLLLRYRLPPRYVTISLDAKDRSIDVGDVLDVTTRQILDTEGQEVETRWQVISFEETASGETVRLELQSYQFVGKFAVIMANDAPDYADATDAEKLNGCWLADDSTGLMPDGSEPYLLQ